MQTSSFLISAKYIWKEFSPRLPKARAIDATASLVWNKLVSSAAEKLVWRAAGAVPRLTACAPMGH